MSRPARTFRRPPASQPAWTTANNGGARRAAARAFTLIELLILAAVLAMVVALLTESADYIRTQGCRMFTESVLARVDTALQQYHATCGVWPPDRFADCGVKPSATHEPRTEGIECMVLAMGRLEFVNEEEYRRARGNLDADVNEPDGRPLYELLDGWGRPLLYYQGYGRPPGMDLEVVLGEPAPPPDLEKMDPRQREKAREQQEKIQEQRSRFAAMPLAEQERLRQIGRELDRMPPPRRQRIAFLQRRWKEQKHWPLVDSAGADGLFDTADDCRQARGQAEGRPEPESAPASRPSADDQGDAP
ncbi:MAG: hypothetical protein BIFFINMI_00979 [Phycisphaerae bacterium]|nr:hypothetical protein [Phycisphaerae bacterium]